MRSDLDMGQDSKGLRSNLHYTFNKIQKVYTVGREHPIFAITRKNYLSPRCKENPFKPTPESGQLETFAWIGHQDDT